MATHVLHRPHLELGSVSAAWWLFADAIAHAAFFLVLLVMPSDQATLGS